MKNEFLVFDNKVELAHHLAGELQSLSMSAEPAYIALSGGSTPLAIFDVWVAEYSTKIKWNNCRFFWVDERCVPPTDDESNYKLANAHLFSKLDIDDDHIFRIMGELHPMDALTEYIEEINVHVPRQNGLPVFDLVVLGMGDDGHTASIFPNEINLWSSENICVIGHHPTTGQSRITLTGSVINHSKKIVFIVTEASKSQKMKEIIGNETVANEYPASLVDKAKTIWLLDKEAASLIK
jgi:6-phosphogluconolactonase